MLPGPSTPPHIRARQLAEAGHQVLVIDKRDHVGGSAHDRLDAHGVLIHPYGPHVLHTDDERVFHYLSRFSAWRACHPQELHAEIGQLRPASAKAHQALPKDGYTTLFNRLLGHPNIDLRLGVDFVVEQPFTLGSVPPVLPAIARTPDEAA